MNAVVCYLATGVAFLAALQSGVQSYHIEGEYPVSDKDSVDRAFAPAKESVDRAFSPAKESVDRVFAPAKESVDRVFAPAKESVDRAYAPYKESVDRAYAPYKESVDRAYAPYKESVDRAYAPYKESVHRAYAPYKESVDRAYAPDRESVMDTRFFKSLGKRSTEFKRDVPRKEAAVIWRREMPELGELYEQTKEKVDQLTEEVKRLSGPEREEALRQLKLVKTERRSIWDDIGNAVKKVCPWNLFKRCSSNSDCGCQYLKCIRRNFFFFTTSSCGYI